MISTLTPEPSSIGTVARKRRRQILQSQRMKTEDDVSPPIKKQCSEPITNSAPRKVSDAQSSLIPTPSSPNNKTKKPQMRYDPDVPMTKEQAAAWRKEQRRKRNRESAAASRQRQRDRISELEQEVTEWKSKYDEALARIEKLEQLRESNTVDCNLVTMRSASELPLNSAAVSLCGSPRLSACPSPSQSCESPRGVVSLQEQNHCVEMDSSIACQLMQESNDHMKHLSEISRPA